MRSSYELRVARGLPLGIAQQLFHRASHSLSPELFSRRPSGAAQGLEGEGLGEAGGYLGGRFMMGFSAERALEWGADNLKYAISPQAMRYFS